MNIFEMFDNGTSDEEMIEAIKELNDINVRDEDDFALLHYACSFGRLEVVKFLIEHSADVNAKDDHDRTPLHTSCYHGHIEIVKILIERGATGVNTEDKYGWTPLFYACFNNNSKIIKFLIEHGVDVQNEFKYWFGDEDIDSIRTLTKAGVCFL